MGKGAVKMKAQEKRKELTKKVKKMKGVECREIINSFYRVRPGSADLKDQDPQEDKF